MLNNAQKTIKDDTMKTIYEQTKLIAHRGFSSRYCENTYPAFLSACKKDFYGVECDIQFTRDNKIVCFHDKSLKRLTGDGRNLKELKHSELKKKILSLKHIKGTFKICPFIKYLKVCKKYDKQCVIEIKGHPSRKQLDIMLKITKRKRKIENCIFISFNTQVLEYIRQKYQNARLQLLISRPLKQYINFCTDNNINVSFLKQLATNSLIKKLNNHNIEVSVWVVNTKPEAQEFVDVGIAHITSNFLL